MKTWLGTRSTLRLPHASRVRGCWLAMGAAGSTFQGQYGYPTLYVKLKVHIQLVVNSYLVHFGLYINLESSIHGTMASKGALHLYVKFKVNIQLVVNSYLVYCSLYINLEPSIHSMMASKGQGAWLLARHACCGINISRPIWPLYFVY